MNLRCGSQLFNLVASNGISGISRYCGSTFTRVGLPINTLNWWWQKLSPLEPSATAAFRLSQTRAIAARDAVDAAAWIIRDFPVPKQLARALPDLLARLISEEVLRGVVVQYLCSPARQPVIAAFGLTGFLAEFYAAQYLASPYPHLELGLLCQTQRSGGCGPFLSHDQIADANAGGRLTALPLLWLQRSNDPSDPEAQALQLASQQSFLRIHRGYRLARVLKETPADRAEAFRAGGFRERHRIPAGTPLPFSDEISRQEHVVFEAKRSDFEGVLPGSMASHVFVYRPPQCNFTRLEKQVLERAVDHLTDEEIASALGIKPGAVALRWRSIYARVTERVPSWFDAEASTESASRGKEKRRRVIAFVSEHPEELRPYPPPLTPAR